MSISCGFLFLDLFYLEDPTTQWTIKPIDFSFKKCLCIRADSSLGMCDEAFSYLGGQGLEECKYIEVIKETLDRHLSKI